MSFFKNIFKTEPFFINEEGTKWWHDEATTAYCVNEDRNGISLKANACFIETIDGYRSRLIIMNGKIIEEDQSLESLATKIEIRKFLMFEQDKEN